MNKVEKKANQEELVVDTLDAVDVEVQDSPSEPKEEPKVLVPNQGAELEKYRYADTVITCALCGTDTNIEHPEFRNVEVGINLPPLYTTNQHFLGLACSNPECKARLTLRMVKAAYPPAYDYNHDNAYNVGLNETWTWVAGDTAESYEVFVKTFIDTEDDAEEPKFESKGVVTDAEFALELAEDTSYMFRVDTKYTVNGDERIVPGPDVFISTKDAPVTAEEVSEDNQEIAE